MTTSAMIPSFGNTPGAVQLYCIVFFSLLLAAGRLDQCTCWAPNELTVPICCLAVAMSNGCTSSSLSGLGICIAAGLFLYLVALLVWQLQVLARRPVMPPADMIALMMPVVLFGMNQISGVFYLLLFMSLLLVQKCRPIWLAMFGMNGEFMSRNRIPLLGMVYPLVVLFMLALQLSTLLLYS